MVRHPYALIPTITSAATFGLACGGSEEGGGGDGGASGGSSASTGNATSHAASSSGAAATGSSGSEASGSGTSATTGGGGPDAVCAAYAEHVVECCEGAPNCGPDTQQDWFDFCAAGYASCAAAYDCLAASSCESDDACPNFGSGCQ